MNKTPDQNKNTYTDYQLSETDGQPFRASRPQRPARPAQNPSGSRPAAPHHPMTEEERRRMEAARAAQNRGHLTEEELRRREEDLRRREEELRRRRQEPPYSRPAPPHTGMEPGTPGAQGGQPPRRVQIPQTPPPRRRRRKKIHINAGLVVFALLIAGTIGVSVHQIQKNGDTPVLPPVSTEAESAEQAVPETEPGLPPDDTSAAVPEEPVTPLYDTVTVSNDTLSDGDLILVNYAHRYEKGDTLELKNAYTDRTGSLKVAATDIGMTPEAFGALESMVASLTADTGCDDLLIVSGHRTIAEQQEVYDHYLTTNGEEYARQYVANPRESEHHTGMACDLSFYTDDGYSVPIPDHEFGYWLGENCMKSGFIRRYPEDKADITKISYEAWHFRYIGIPHAFACTAFDACLEEYIDLLKQYTLDTKLLYIHPDGTVGDQTTENLPEQDGWLAYYVPMTEGDSTDIPLLPGEAYQSYELSGNNVDGFIVTVTLP